MKSTMESVMSISRRQFLGSASVSVSAVPLLLTFGADYCEASTSAVYDLSMGMPAGAVRLNYNENALGPSPLAIAGARAGVEEANRYALGGLLTPLLAEHHGIDKEWLLMGTGSTEVLRLAPISYLQTGGNVISFRETWDGLVSVAENMGAPVNRLRLSQREDYSYDTDEILKAVDANTRIIFIASPNNPTGSALSSEQLQALAGNLPGHVLLVLDEAYVHYQAPGHQTGFDLIKAGYTNVLVTRTFSKVHALAGLRCGYGAGHPDILKNLKKFGCDPGSTNRAAFGAVQGALADVDQVERSRQHVQQARNYYEQQCRDIGLATISGVPPFIMIDVGTDGDAIQNELSKRNVFVRSGKSWDMPHHLRVSFGQPHENEAFFRALREVI